MNLPKIDNGCEHCSKLICADPFMCSVHARLIADVVITDLEAAFELELRRRDRVGRPTPNQWNQQRGVA
jgi:hypothetical protein